MSIELNQAIEKYIAAMIEDYRNWGASSNENFSDEEAALRKKIRDKMFQEFVDSNEVIPGSKYIRIFFNNSVHSFIVAKDTPKFKLGTILKANTWKAPATNFSRGSVFEPESYKNHRWTGAQ